jgi:Tfp pilus assembly PilM family ATPase
MGVAPLCERRDSTKVWGGNDVIGWSISDIAGVHLGDSQITVTRMAAKGTAVPVVTHAGWAPYDPSASEKDIAGVIKELWRAARVPTKLVCASLRSSATVMRYFKFPMMSADELGAALMLQAEEALQLARENVSVDWHIQERVRSNSNLRNAMIEGVLFAAPAKDVDRQLAIMAQAGLDPVIVDMRAMAVANLFAMVAPKKEEETVCLVNLAPHSADVIILSKGAIYPYTVFCRASTWVESPGFLCENIRDVMKYGEFKLDWEPARRVLLTGHAMAAGDFIARIQEGMGIPVATWDPLKCLDVKVGRVKDLLDSNPNDAAMLAPSLGLSLRRG